MVARALPCFARIAHSLFGLCFRLRLLGARKRRALSRFPRKPNLLCGGVSIWAPIRADTWRRHCSRAHISLTHLHASWRLRGTRLNSLSGHLSGQVSCSGSGSGSGGGGGGGGSGGSGKTGQSRSSLRLRADQAGSALGSLARNCRNKQPLRVARDFHVPSASNGRPRESCAR